MTARRTTGPASSSDKIDNPDQRIQFDIDIFTANKGPLPNVPYTGTESTLLFGGINAVISVISFTAILWNLSGPMTMPMVGYELPRAMFWIGIVFVLVAICDRVLDRPADHLAVVRQREVQRGVPVRAGAIA